jgi:ankyrin repeat protein
MTSKHNYSVLPTVYTAATPTTSKNNKPTTLKALMQKTKSRSSSMVALKGRKTTVLLKQYRNNDTPPDQRKDLAKQLLSAFTLEDRMYNAMDRSKPLPKGSRHRKIRERFRAAIRACQLNHSDILLLLIRQFHVDPNRQDNNTGATLLTTSIHFGHIECCILLISQRGIKIDMTDRWGWSALHWASTDANRVDILEHLLRNHCDKNLKDGMSGRTSIELCCQNGNEEGALALLNSSKHTANAGGVLKLRYKIPKAKGFNLTFDLPTWAIPASTYDIRSVLLLVLATLGDVKKIGKLLHAIDKEKRARKNETKAARERAKQDNRGPVIDYRRTPRKETSLMRCATHKQSKTLKFILENSKENCQYINAESDTNGSALGMACGSGCIACTNLLIKYGAFIHREELHTGLTPLMTACKSGEFPDLLDILFRKHYVNVDQVDTHDHLSAMMVSAWSGHSENVIALLKCDANVTLCSNAGVSCLMMMCAKSLDWCVRKTIEKYQLKELEEEEKVEREGEQKESRPGSFLFKLLNAVDEDGWNSLRWACEGNSLACIDLLLDTHLISIPPSAFEINPNTGTWIEPAYLQPYIECVRGKIQKHLIKHNLEQWVGAVPVAELLLSTKGDYNQAMKLSVVRAQEAIVRHEKQEKRMHNEILRTEVVHERSRRARGGVHYSATGEVSSLLDKSSTRSSTTSVNDLAFMLLPELSMSVPKPKEGVWSML